MLNVKVVFKHLLPQSRRNRHALHPDQVRAAKLAELGSQLRRLREEQSLPLDQIVNQTKIQRRHLLAIEQGKVEQLPEPVYIQGFIKLYADALGLDGHHFAGSFPVNGLPQAVVSGPVLTWRSLPAAQLQPVHLYLLYIFLVVGAVNALSYIIDRSPTQAVGTADLEESYALLPPLSTKAPSTPLIPANPLKAAFPLGQIPVEPDKRSPVVAQLNPQISFPTDPALMGKPVRVMVTLKGQSWIRVTTDNKVDFEGVLQEGTQRTWAADRQVTIRAGNAGGVMVTFNNAPPQPLGSPGSVEEVTFALDSKQQEQPNSGAPDSNLFDRASRTQGSALTSLFDNIR